MREQTREKPVMVNFRLAPLRHKALRMRLFELGMSLQEFYTVMTEEFLDGTHEDDRRHERSEHQDANGL